MGWERGMCSAQCHTISPFAVPVGKQGNMSSEPGNCQNHQDHDPDHGDAGPAKQTMPMPVPDLEVQYTKVSWNNLYS